MRVLVPGPLLSYTAKREVEAVGATLADLLQDMERQYPGLRFRIIDEQGHVRPHMRIFINGKQAFETERTLQPDDEVQLVQALSGG